MRISTVINRLFVLLVYQLRKTTCASPKHIRYTLYIIFPSAILLSAWITADIIREVFRNGNKVIEIRTSVTIDTVYYIDTEKELREEIIKANKELKNNLHKFSYEDIIPYLPQSTPKEKTIIKTIKRFYPTAIYEGRKYSKIKPSVKMAQAILESIKGNGAYSTLAIKYNNWFGIKCWTKDCGVNYHDDSHHDRFKTYSTAWESWRDHSLWLESRDHYKLHRSMSVEEYIDNLMSGGYATNPNYKKHLLTIIYKYKLYLLDNSA